MLKKHLVKHLPDNELNDDEVIPKILQQSETVTPIRSRAGDQDRLISDQFHFI